jgi:hypothetical protein
MELKHPVLKVFLRKKTRACQGKSSWLQLWTASNACRFEIFEIVREIPIPLHYNLTIGSCIQGSVVLKSFESHGVIQQAVYNHEIN